jgi:glycogen phosphorylase
MKQIVIVAAGLLLTATNGALTIGTLDGANIEIRDAVGHENFFLFRLSADEVSQRKADGYRPRRIFEENPELREAVRLIDSGYFSNGDRELFRPLIEYLLN